MRSRRLAAAAAALALAASARPAGAAPAQVVIIRNAEKPLDGPDLDPNGRERAKALVGYFRHAADVTKYGPPAGIYAMDPGDDHGSARTSETVQPLAKALKLPIVTAFRRKQIPQLVRDVLDNPAYNGKSVLICWEYKTIPDIVSAFGWDGAPAKWAGYKYDRAWVLSLAGGEVFSFADVPQRLLPDDDDK